MSTQYLSINELSLYSGLKKSFLYSQVEAGDIPHYKIGRLIRFKKEDFDTWMEGHKVDVGSTDRKAQQILKTINKSNLDINRFVKKTIADVKENEYTLTQGKPDQVRGLRKEVSYGTL